MNKKFFMAVSLAVTLTAILTSLALAADPTAYVQFTTDAPCQVVVSAISYTTPANQPGSIISNTTPWTLPTYPQTLVEFSYPPSVVCGGVTYNWESFSTNNPVMSGVAGSTTIVEARYTAAGDKTPPVVTVPADIVTEATGTDGAVVDFSGLVSAQDNVDGAISPICTPASGSTFPLGTTPVTCTATDTSGNSGSGGFNVTVVDTALPVVVVPADIVTEATGPAGAVVNFLVTASDTVDGAISPICTPTSGSTFPLGTTPVTCTATDTSGNSGSGSFNVTVVDTTLPVVVVPADIVTEATGPAGVVVDFLATASDTVDGNITPVCTPASGSTFPLGTTPVTCTATDAHGNTGSGSFNVTVTLVADTTPPVLNLPSEIIVTASNASGRVVNYTNQVSANDAVDGPVPVICSPASDSLFPIGTTRVNCSAADSQGNGIEGSFTVSVRYAVDGECGGVPGHQVLQPLNTDDGSNIFQQGSTVPVKFRVCGEDGESIGTPGVVTDLRLINSDEAVISTSAHEAFRAGEQQWIFNLSTSNLTAGNTYIYLIMLNDGSTIQFQFTLK